MEQFYTDERNVQILIALLKEHGIKKVVASPGSTNVTFVGSIQQDSFFEIYSSVDERSAAYIACGLAAESGESVALSCTGATASRNYYPALTEAFYRKLPILAITSTQDESKIGHMIPQIIDRTVQPLDTVKCSVHLQTVKDAADAWDCNVKANKAILELTHGGNGPVHINLTTTYSRNFMVKELKRERKIERVMTYGKFPDIPKGKIAVYIGSHVRMSKSLAESIDLFCETHNAIVAVDPTANYTGRYRVPYMLVAQQSIEDENRNPDLLIHIGEMSDMAGIVGQPKSVWRVNEDGKIVDRFQTLRYVFEMPEHLFFEHYSKSLLSRQNTYYNSCMEKCNYFWNNIPELPFSHIWVAFRLHNLLPMGSVLHLGILSPLRSWGYFPIPSHIEVYCNQGGFGIDGNMSSLLGASLVHPEKLYFGVVGDLSFFYDMNVLGNRHVGENVRILLINNALAAEFHLFKQTNLTKVNEIERFLSAGGHFGCKSLDVVKHLVEDWGYEYLTASTKEDFEKVYERFITPDLTEKPMIFEVFTDVNDENEALRRMYFIESSTRYKVKNAVKNIIGEDRMEIIKKIIKR